MRLTEALSMTDWVKQMKQIWEEQRDMLVPLINPETVAQFERELHKVTGLTTEERTVPVDEELAECCVALYQRWEEMNADAEVVHLQKRHAEPMSARAVPIGGHRLPPLPYPFNALEPYISEEIMRLHYSKHHQSYVDGLNKAEKNLQEARRKGDFSFIKHWERELAFHGAGHYLHTIFWQMMSPNGGGEPSRALAEAIKRDFGSFAKFKQQFSEAADKVEGSGWAILVWSPRAHRLEILQAEKHQNLSQWDVIPLLPLDVWEHAYYLDYKNDRAQYSKQWWNVVNWREVERRFDEASKLRWQPF